MWLLFLYYLCGADRAKGPPIDEVEGIATDMQYYSDKDLLAGGSLYYEYQPELIHQLLGQCVCCIRDISRPI
jgi:hypothetical protein